MQRKSAEDRALLEAYRATVWTVHLPPGPVAVHLSSRPAALRGVGLITAFNPASRLASARENADADQRLRDELRALGTECWRCVAGGTGPDAERWREPGYAVRGVARGILIALGAQHRQNAILWIDAEARPSLIVTRPGFCGSRLGATLDDLPAKADHARSTPHEPRGDHRHPG